VPNKNKSLIIIMQMHLVFIIFCIVLENLPQGAAIDKHWNRFKVTLLNQTTKPLIFEENSYLAGRHKNL
jgi:hypothetical protein